MAALGVGVLAKILDRAVEQCALVGHKCGLASELHKRAFVFMALKNTRSTIRAGALSSREPPKKRFMIPRAASSSFGRT